jgi:hypothetical protein
MAAALDEGAVAKPASGAGTFPAQLKAPTTTKESHDYRTIP